MPRTKRLHVPGCLVHVIVRTVDERYIFTTDEIRHEYLRRLSHAMAKTDWRLAAYAVMSNHVHLVLLSGQRHLGEWAKRLHSGFASWYHEHRRDQGISSRGPLIAERPTSLYVELSVGPRLVPYVHNNPVRAGVVARPEDSSWTSHRAIVGLEAPLPQLDVRLALELCGVSTESEFGCVVAGRMYDPSDPELTDRAVPAARNQVRKAFGSGVEVETATYDAGLHVRPAPGPDTHVRAGYLGSVEDVLRAVAVVEEVSVAQMRERLRRGGRTRARRVALLTWYELERPMAEMAAALAVSRVTASETVAKHGEDRSLRAAVRRVIRYLLRDDAQLEVA